MIIRRPREEKGVKFAWWPVWTPDGTVWLEHVHFCRNDDSTADDSYARVHWRQDAFGYKMVDYSKCSPRFVPDDVKTFAELGDNWKPQYVTPPDISKCEELRSDGPTPCRFPGCSCNMLGSGDRCGG